MYKLRQSGELGVHSIWSKRFFSVYHMFIFISQVLFYYTTTIISMMLFSHRINYLYVCDCLNVKCNLIYWVRLSTGYAMLRHYSLELHLNDLVGKSSAYKYHTILNFNCISKFVCQERKPDITLRKRRLINWEIVNFTMTSHWCYDITVYSLLAMTWNMIIKNKWRRLYALQNFSLKCFKCPHIAYGLWNLFRISIIITMRKRIIKTAENSDEPIFSRTKAKLWQIGTNGSYKSICHRSFVKV